MIVFGVVLIFFLLIGWSLCLAYTETEQDFPPVRCSTERRPPRVVV